MFIGFSFLGLISNMLEYLQKFMYDTYLKKNKNNVIQVKEAANESAKIMEESINEFRGRMLEESTSDKS